MMCSLKTVFFLVTAVTVHILKLYVLLKIYGSVSYSLSMMDIITPLSTTVQTKAVTF